MVVDTLNLKTPVPCIQGFFTDRIVTYTTQVSPKQIMNLLGHDPRSKNWKRLPDELKKIYEYLQRKTSKDRREGVAGYIEERFGPDAIAIGAFPAISIAIQQPTEFRSYGGVLPGAVGELMIDIAPLNFRVLIDGLSRVTGALDLAEEGHEGPLANFMFPVTIYAPRAGTKPFTWRDMGQLFHDFNFRVQPVAKQHAVALDTSDIYISLANRLAKAPVFVTNGGVAERAASLGSKSTEIVVQTVLVRTVRGACEGRKFQESNLANADNPNLTMSTFGSLLGSLDEFFSGLAQRMGPERFTDRQSLHLTSPGWQALGVLHHDLVFKLKFDVVDRAKVLDKIASIDWSRYNPDWMTLGIGHPEVDKKTGHAIVDEQGRQRVALTGAGRTNTQKLLDYMREKAGISHVLAKDDVEDLAA
jgi:hypothetical protein